MSTTHALHLPNEAATQALAQALAKALEEPLVIYLLGDLAAGKTTFARALLRQLGVSGTIPSPTYALMEAYDDARIPALHVDAYRLAHAEELEYLGLADQAADRLLLVEWPERGTGFLPPSDLTLSFEHAGEARELRMRAETRRGEKMIAAGLENMPDKASLSA